MPLPGNGLSRFCSMTGLGIPAATTTCADADVIANRLSRGIGSRRQAPAVWLSRHLTRGTRRWLPPSSASSSSYPHGHIDDLAAQVGNVLADVFGTELVCRTVEILRQLHADVVRAWLRALVA
jgi:hypothetical protein